MNQLGQREWLARELDYRSNIPFDEIAEKYGMTVSAVQSWRKLGWSRKGPIERIRQLQLMQQVDKAETLLLSGQVEEANALLRTVNALVRANTGIARLMPATPEQDLHNEIEMKTDTDAPEDDRSLEELKEEFKRDLFRQFGLETKSDDRRDRHERDAG